MNDETRVAIMEATRRALCEHGNAGLTVQHIADESSLSSAAIHYHFDTKEALLEAFLEYLLAEFETRLAPASEAPDERLRTFLDTVFPTGSYEGIDDPDDAPVDRFAVALVEIMAQAPYNPTYRDRLVAMDERVQVVVAEAVADGVETGVFDPVDPEAVARFVVTAIHGAHLRDVALSETPARTRELVAAHLERRLGHPFGGGG